ncbi:hypothetical protein ACFLY8_02485 [Halobacteriota archaeon]
MKWKISLIFILALCLLTVPFSGCVSAPEPTPTPTMPTRTAPVLPTKAPTPAPTPAPAPKPTPDPTPAPASTPLSTQKSWHKVTNITGRRSDRTEPFMINADEWRIRWSFTMSPECPSYASFFFTIYPEGEYVEAGRYVRHIENITHVPYYLGGNSTTYSGTTYIHQGPDSFYVKMVSSMPWELEIEEYR